MDAQARANMVVQIARTLGELQSQPPSTQLETARTFERKVFEAAKGSFEDYRRRIEKRLAKAVRHALVALRSMSAQAAAIASAFEPAAKRQRTDGPLHGQEHLPSHGDRSPAMQVAVSQPAVRHPGSVGAWHQVSASQSQATVLQPGVRHPGSVGTSYQEASSQSQATASQPTMRHPGSAGVWRQVAASQSQSTASQSAVRHPESIGAWHQATSSQPQATASQLAVRHPGSLGARSIVKQQQRQTEIQQANQQPRSVTVWDNAHQHEEQQKQERQRTLQAALEGPHSFGARRQMATQHRQHPRQYPTLQSSAQQPGPGDAGSHVQKQASPQLPVQPYTVMAVSHTAEQPQQQPNELQPAVQHVGAVESWQHGRGLHQPQAPRQMQPQPPLLVETAHNRAKQQQPQAQLQQNLQPPQIGQATRNGAEHLPETLHRPPLQARGQQQESDTVRHQERERLQQRATLQPAVHQTGCTRAWHYKGSQQHYRASIQNAAKQPVIVDTKNEEMDWQQRHPLIQRDMQQPAGGEANREATEQQQEKLRERPLNAVEGQFESTSIVFRTGEQQQCQTTSPPALQQPGTAEPGQQDVKQTAQQLSSQQPVGPAGIEAQNLSGLRQHVGSKPDLQQPRDTSRKTQSGTSELNAQVAGDVETFHGSPSGKNPHTGVEETKKEGASHTDGDKGALGDEVVARLLEEHRDVLEWFGKTCVKTVIPRLSGWAAGEGGSDTDARLRERAADAASKMKMHVKFAQRILRMLASKGGDVDKVPKWCAQLRQRRQTIEQFISNAERRRPESGLVASKLDLASLRSSQETSMGIMLAALPCLARFDQLFVKDRERSFVAVSPLDSMKARITLLFGDDRSVLTLSVVLVSIEEDIDGNGMPESAFALWRLATARASQAATSLVASAVSTPNEPASSPLALVAAILIESAKIVSQCASCAARNVAERRMTKKDSLSSQISKHNGERANHGVKAADLYVPPRSPFRFTPLHDVGQPAADLGGAWGQ